jgi:restriction endonuclease S subunit
VKKFLMVSQVAEVLRGTTPAPKDSDNDGPIFIGQTEVTSGAYGTMRHVVMNDEDQKLAPVLLEPGDVVIASMDRSHHALLIREDMREAVLGRECVAIRLSSNVESLTPSFLAIWARSDDFVRQADAMMTGTTMPRLTMKALGTMMVPLPDRDVMLSIEATAKKYDDAIRAASDTLEQLKVLQDLELDLAIQEALRD